MGGGSKGTTKQTTSAEPWKGVQPYLKSAFKDLGTVYKEGAPDYYPGDTVAPQSDYTKSALDQLAARGAAGSQVTDAAQNELMKTMNGDYLNGETPGFKGALDAATRPITDNYTKSVIPNLESAFSSAGRYGGGAHADAESDAYSGMLREIGDVSSDMSYKNYGDERQRQIQGMLFAPQLAQQDYMDINAMGQAGAGIDQYNQAKIDADVGKYDYNSNKDLNWITQNLGTLMGTPWGQSQTAKGAQPSVFSGALSGAMGGAGLGSLMTAAGAAVNPLWAAGGAGAGILSSLF